MWSNVISSYKNICFRITHIIYLVQDILHLFFRKLHLASCFVNYCQNLPLCRAFILTVAIGHNMPVGEDIINIQYRT